MTDVRIDLVRLTEVPLDAVVALLNEPRNTDTREVLQRGFTELGLTDVLIALPHTRSPDRAVARLGFQPDGEVDYGGVVFRQYRLTRRRGRQPTARPDRRHGNQGSPSRNRGDSPS